LIVQQQKENSHLSHAMPPINNNAKQSAMRLFEQFLSLSTIQMAQPSPSVTSFSVNWPGKQHSSLLKKSNRIKGIKF
jgi:hypothetical protein